MGAVNTTYTFTATDTITSAKMNNIIDQTTVTTDAIIGTTLDVASGKLKIRSAGITSNEMGNNSITTSSITDASVTPTKLSAGGPNWTTSTTSLGNAVTGSYTASVAPDRTGDGATAIQLGAQTGVSSSASITRNSGVDGTLEITNTGTGAIALSASGGVNLGSGGVTFGTANMPNPSGTAPIYGVRAWANFDALVSNNVSGTYSRSGTIITIDTTIDHGLLVGHHVYLTFTGGTGSPLAVNGLYQVASVTDSNTFTVTSVASGTITGGSVTLNRKTIRGSGNVANISASPSSPVVPPTTAQSITNACNVVNLSVEMPNSNFCVVGSANENATLTTNAGNQILTGYSVSNKVAYLLCVTTASNFSDTEYNNVMIIG